MTDPAIIWFLTHEKGFVIVWLIDHDNVAIEWPIADASCVADCFTDSSAIPESSSIGVDLATRIRVSAGHPKV